MHITKYDHACLVLEEQGSKLIIDPGEYTPNIGDVSSTVGVVITHVHGDHFAPGNVAAILAANPEVQVWSTAEVAEQLGNPQVQVVTGGSTATVGPFTMQFYGSKHALVHGNKPENQNVGVLVNDLYYPGDSFDVPNGAAVKTLAVPASAPWLKIGESMDFILAVKPQQCFPTHNAMLSAVGQASANAWLAGVCETQHIAFTYLQVGQTLDT